MLNPWVNYVTRSYSEIKASINLRLDTVVPELTDKSPSNLMQVLIDVWAGVGELLNYYIDTTARELFVPSARRFSSILKLAELAGYNGQAAVPANTYLIVNAIDGSGDPIAQPSNFTIGQGIQLTDTNGFVWTVDFETTLRKGTDSVKVSVSQYKELYDQNLGPTPGPILLPRDYAEGSLDITISGETWTRVNAFGYYGPLDKVFLTKLLSDGLVYLVFGDGVNGQIPTAGIDVLATYRSTQGLTGNADINTIISWVIEPVPPEGTLTASNPQRAYGGVNIQGIEEVRQAIPISQRTLDRAVTKKDYEDTAILFPGIRAARVSFDCGPRIEIYCVGEGGGNPSQGLLDNAKTFIEEKSIVTLAIATLPSGESHVKGTVDITGRFRQTKATIETQVNDALEALYDPQSSKINQPVRMSDVIAAIDNAPSVDFLTLNSFYVEPYLRPSNLSTVLIYTIKVTKGLGYINWDIICTDATLGSEVFSLRRNGSNVGTVIADGVPVIAEEIEISISDATGVQVNDSWTFTVGPFMDDVILKDMSIPIILQTDETIVTPDFLLDIVETYIQS